MGRRNYLAGGALRGFFCCFAPYLLLFGKLHRDGVCLIYRASLDLTVVGFFGIGFLSLLSFVVSFLLNNAGFPPLRPPFSQHLPLPLNLSHGFPTPPSDLDTNVVSFPGPRPPFFLIPLSHLSDALQNLFYA